MSHLISSTHLKGLVGADAHTLFQLLPCCSNFLKQNLRNWSQNADFRVIKNVIENLLAVNDGAERVLSQVTDRLFLFPLQRT